MKRKCKHCGTKFDDKTKQVLSMGNTNIIQSKMSSESEEVIIVECECLICGTKYKCEGKRVKVTTPSLEEAGDYAPI